MSKSKIPTKWAESKIGEVFEFCYGKALSKTNRSSSGTIPVYGSNGITGYHDEAFIEQPCLLVGRKGAAGKVSKALSGCWPIDTTYFVQVPEGLDFEFCYYLFLVQRFEKFEKSTAIPSLSRDDAYEQEIAIPPLAEQRRIVGKVEELFSELDEGVANLKQARAQLAVYRQALLKHAFEGHLTADWRTKHAPELESADQLLARIRAEREERYQRQLKEWEELHTKWERTGGKTTKPSKPGKPVPQSPISAETLKTLPNLPEGWAHLRLGELIDEPAYGTSKKCDYETKGTGVLRIPNVVAGSVDATDLKYASFTPEEVQGYALEAGDLLMIRSNGSVSIVGRCALIRDIHTHLLYAGYLIRLRPHASAVDPAFLHRQLLSHALRHQIEQAAKSTSGVNNINSGEIQSLVIAVCSVAEQQEIITQLEEKLSAISALEADIDLNLQKAEALRQSILKKAFAGELVPQDPADEPAAALLARIRAEREAQPVNRRTRR